MKFGAHCSTAGGMHQALARCRSIKGDICQIFVKNNMQWFGKTPPPPDVALFAEELERGDISAVFGHAGYLINLGAPPSENRDRSIQSLIQEIEIATVLGLPFLVLHPGAHLGGGEEAGIKWAVEGLDAVFSATRKSPVRIALENTAGQGTCLGYRIAHLAAIFDGCATPARLGVCLDTAHFLASGYDIRSGKGWDATIREVGSMIGLKRILAFHLNDSKTDLNSRVDRHEHIGKGHVGKEAFRHIVNDPRFKNHPGCLETPKGPDLKDDLRNLAILRSLVANGN